MNLMNLEWIAELADREPTAEERDFLAEHPELQAEADALIEQTSALGELPSLRPPRGDWAALEARLMSEGLIHSRKNTLLSLPVQAGWTRAAAAVALFLGGTFTGVTVADGGGSSPTLAASIDTVGEAERAVELTERQYLNSLVRYRELSAMERDAGAFADSRERAAALDLLVQASENALQRAPDDPFINLFLVSTLAEQRATSRTSRGRDNWF